MNPKQETTSDPVPSQRAGELVIQMDGPLKVVPEPTIRGTVAGFTALLVELQEQRHVTAIRAAVHDARGDAMTHGEADVHESELRDYERASLHTLVADCFGPDYGVWIHTETA